MTLAILRVDPAGSTLTSSHVIFARICLEARAFAAALPVLDKEIFYFPPIGNKIGENNLYPYLCSDHDTGSTFMTPDSGLSAKLDHRDTLQYFLFGGMIYMGLKDWKKAFTFLEIALVTPVVGNASKIQVEAYKKWVLVGLLHKGYVSPNFITILFKPQDLMMSRTVSIYATNDKYTSCEAVPCSWQSLRSFG